TFVVHHEVAQGQGEIGVKFGTLIEAADNVQKLKYVVKMVAHRHGKTATFMPKPLYGDNGNGMHTHQSVWKDGKPLFAGSGYQNLSDVAMNYIGGVLKNGKSIAAFTNASTNSYKRLMPGFEAPSILAYSAQNRSASARIPFVNSDKARRVEFRFPDSSANPYLAFASMLMAGIDGIKKKIDPGPPHEEDLFELSTDEIKAKGINLMPYTLRDALTSLEGSSDFLRAGDVFTDHFLKTYIQYKYDTEVTPYEGRPHPIEFVNTYSC
ncbi:MAG TPA: type I glutamate--ammonia ligase, partial [Leptospiraceae bacterium]|nr:type I glutamate--ammonia ligase [Leptospiraceae bacterium]